MPRSQRLSMSQQQSQSSNVLLSQMVRREDDYRAGINGNHNLAIMLAGRLKHGGQLEEMLEDFDEYREHVKKITEQNVLEGRKLSAYISALGNIMNVEDVAEVDDYDSALESAMDKELRKITKNSVDVRQERMYLDICSKLGEASAAGANGDDDLEIMAEESTLNLKCPIMGSLMQDPVKNKVCGHTYSKVAILNHIAIDRRCPVAGCQNLHVKQDQLEPDMETTAEIRRERIRQEHAQRQMTQNAIDMDDDDDTML